MLRHLSYILEEMTEVHSFVLLCSKSRFFYFQDLRFFVLRVEDVTQPKIVFMFKHFHFQYLWTSFKRSPPDLPYFLSPMSQYYPWHFVLKCA